MALTAPQEASVVTVANRADPKIPKRTSLPSMFPPSASTPSALESRVACRFGPPADEDPGQEKGKHHPPDGPAVTLVLHHPAQGIGQAAGDEEDGEHLQKVGKRRRVFEGVGGIGIEKAAAVCPQHLDRHLRCHGTLGDGLGVDRLLLHDRISLGIQELLACCILLGDLNDGRFHEQGRIVGLEILDRSLGNEKEGVEQRRWAAADRDSRGPGRPRNFRSSGLNDGRSPGRERRPLQSPRRRR